MQTQSQSLLYRWSELPSDSPMALITRKRVIGEQAMLSRVELTKGCDIPMHAHPNEQFACVISGRARFRIGGEKAMQTVRKSSPAPAK